MGSKAADIVLVVAIASIFYGNSRICMISNVFDYYVYREEELLPSR